MLPIKQPEACGLSRNDIEAIAEEIAQHCEYGPGGSLIPVVQSLNGTLEYTDLSGASGESGSIVMHPDRFEIVLARHTGPLRDRFTIAHELGHLFLHYFGFGFHEQKVTMEAQRYGRGQIETEANWFAAAFLMPESEFKVAYDNFKKDLGSTAGHFRVSEAAAEVRARSLRI